MHLPKTIKVVRMQEVGEPMILEEIETPTPSAHDVLVRVQACVTVSDLANAAIFGLDPVGEIVATCSQVHAGKVGQRGYVNSGRRGTYLRHFSDGITERDLATGLRNLFDEEGRTRSTV